MNEYTLPASIVAHNQREDGLCWACKGVPASEWHHIHPRNLGGAQDSPQAHLCGSCHNLVHKTAFKIARGEDAGQLTPMQSLLSKYIVQCMVDPTSDDDTPRKIILEVPDRLLRRLHVKKTDAGFTNLSKYIITLLEMVARRP